MNDLDLENKKWLARLLARAGRGEKGRIANAAGIDGTKLSRMANTDPDAKPKNTQIIPLEVLRRLAAVFEKEDPPPGLASREIPPPPQLASHELVRVPLLDRVPAGKMRQPLSQIPAGADYLSVADLGRGSFFALTVEGDSMDRLVPNGARVIVDESDRTLVTNKPYVISNRGEVSLKLWKPGPPRFAPYSFNPTYEPI